MQEICKFYGSFFERFILFWSVYISQKYSIEDYNFKTV